MADWGGFANGFPPMANQAYHIIQSSSMQIRPAELNRGGVCGKLHLVHHARGSRLPFQGPSHTPKVANVLASSDASLHHAGTVAALFALAMARGATAKSPSSEARAAACHPHPGSAVFDTCRWRQCACSAPPPPTPDGRANVCR